MPERPSFPKRAVVTAGMPYGNKGLHFGHVAGVFVPADVYARFLRDRIGPENVLFVSGTDCYGSPIYEGYRKLVESGEFDGSIRDYVERNHEAQKATLDAYDVSLDMFEGSALGRSGEVHAEVTKRFIRRLYENGWLERRSALQFYDAKAGTFLNGRQVTGRCPVQGCKSEKAYADECDLGHQFMPEDLIAPKSSLTGETPELRPVDNWYFKLPEMRGLVAEHFDRIAPLPTTRDVTVSTVREFLVPPVIYVKNEYEDVYRSVAEELPPHRFTPAEKGKSSFTLAFDGVDARDEAKRLLSQAGVAKFRTGKALVPFRLTGNIEWGLEAPTLEDEGPLTVWCWPESLWAPISFTIAALEERGRDASEWKSWWCSDDARVYQFIGQDNIYFYGVAQTALWSATQEGEPEAEGKGDELRQTTLVPNYHVLFMGKKASSSGAVKPPSADELLEHYTVEQLRAHWAALGLGVKSASFNPKTYDPSASSRAPDPALKEGALLTNIFNRIARSCFYTAQKWTDGKAPLGEVSPEVKRDCEEAVLEYEQHMYRFETWAVMAQMDEFLRGVNKWWSDASRAALSGDDPAHDVVPVLRDAFQYLRTSIVLMHPIVPRGCELVFSYLDIRQHEECSSAFAGFFDWDHIFEQLDFWADPDERESGWFTLKELPPRFDFFAKHPGQT